MSGFGLSIVAFRKSINDSTDRLTDSRLTTLLHRNVLMTVTGSRRLRNEGGRSGALCSRSGVKPDLQSD